MAAWERRSGRFCTAARRGGRRRRVGAV